MWLFGEWRNLVLSREWFRDNWRAKKQEYVEKNTSFTYKKE